MTPTEWFDQLIWWYAAHPVSNPQWCARHWAPCPAMGANGIAAAMELTGLFLEQNPDKSPDQLNEAMDQMLLDTPQCCQLGDEKMHEIWGRCPPAGMRSTQGESDDGDS